MSERVRGKKIRITHKMNAADDDRKREERERYSNEKINRIYMANKCF